MNPEYSGVPLRRRVLVSILAVTALAVILFALPLGVAVQRLYRTEAVTALQRDAARAAAAPTVASARTAEVPQIQGSAHGFSLTGISTVSRSAGTAVLIRYSADSQPDPVTGKVYKDTFERYEFYRNGTEAALLLGGPAGADNVDPWRTVTNSFRWLR